MFCRVSSREPAAASLESALAGHDENAGRSTLRRAICFGCAGVGTDQCPEQPLKCAGVEVAIGRRGERAPAERTIPDR